MKSKQSLQHTLNKNQYTLDILSVEDLMAGWEEKTGKSRQEILFDNATLAANHVSPTIDATVAAKLVKDLGFSGEVIIKTVKGKQYAIFKGLPGTRSIFTGTRYLADNAKVVDMAIGRRGVNKAIVSGARLTIYLVIPLNILRAILDDKYTLSKLIGQTAYDLASVGISVALASVAATATAAFTTLAAGPIVVAIVVGLGVGWTMIALDKRYGIVDKLSEAIDKSYDNTIGAIGRGLRELERILTWQAMHSVPVGRGIFY
jgi:hypothetical protein